MANRRAYLKRWNDAEFTDENGAGPSGTHHDGDGESSSEEDEDESMGGSGESGDSDDEGAGGD